LSNNIAAFELVKFVPGSILEYGVAWNSAMDKKLFNDLLESVHEGGRVLRGEIEPSRRFVVTEPDVKAIRRKLGRTQPQFAELLGVGIGTLRHWEQGDHRGTHVARPKNESRPQARQGVAPGSGSLTGRNDT
jgi:putative transcriptional regulator